jgi:hypothetical protein
MYNNLPKSVKSFYCIIFSFSLLASCINKTEKVENKKLSPELERYLSGETQTETQIEDESLNSSVGTTSSSSEANQIVYQEMSIVFKGQPSISEIQPLMEAVLEGYNLEPNQENLSRVSSMLIGLSDKSKVQVTEIDILKHMYQQGSRDIHITEQAAFSFVYLERTN